MSKTNIGTLGTAVVTGASSGIGKVYADRLAARGHNLLLVARRADRLAALSQDLQSRYPVRVETLVADLSTSAGLSVVVEKLSTDAAITMLVNNAGISAIGPLSATSLELLSKLVALNITALSALTRAVLPNFEERNAGTIVNIGSVVGYGGFAGTPIYGASKAYVLNFTQALQKQLAETRIRVQLVAPAATVSEIWDSIGYPLSNLDPASVMTTEDCVDAALKGLDSGERLTSPSLQDPALLETYEAASEALLQATQATGKAAPRYGLGS